VILSGRNPSRHDLPIFAENYRTAVNPEKLQRLASKLGLSVVSLERLGIGWSHDHRAWSFPMTDAMENVIGIHLRLESGKKISVKGGCAGLHVPKKLSGLDASTTKSTVAGDETLLITEGPTDCAAMLDLGFTAIGRSSCVGGIKLLTEFLQMHNLRETVIVADADEAGQRGAKTLACVLAAYTRQLRIITSPSGIKDARAWKLSGATAEDVMQTMADSPVRRLKMLPRIVSRRCVSHGR
jgi:hypothetical protein